MKKLLLIFLILFPFNYGFTFDFNHLFNSSKFYYRFDSFFGTDYFPTKNYKTFNYFDNHYFYSGWKYDFKDNYSVWLDITFNDKLFDKEILLNKTGIAYSKNNYCISYKIDKLKYGNRSYIYNISVADRFFDKGVIEQYRYNGLEMEYKFSNLILNSKIAANTFHTAVLDNSIRWQTKNKSTKIYFLFTPRNSEYNEINFSFGTEIYLKREKIRFYESFVYQYLPYYSKGDKIKSLSEIVITLNPNLFLGTNFFYESFKLLANWQSQSFIKFKFSKLTNFLTFRYSYMNEFISAEINREISLLNIFNISNNFSVGLNNSYLHPSFDKDYYQFGIQAKIYYETE